MKNLSKYHYISAFITFVTASVLFVFMFFPYGPVPLDHRRRLETNVNLRNIAGAIEDLSEMAPDENDLLPVAGQMKACDGWGRLCLFESDDVFYSESGRFRIKLYSLGSDGINYTQDDIIRHVFLGRENLEFQQELISAVKSNNDVISIINKWLKKSAQ